MEDENMMNASFPRSSALAELFDLKPADLNASSFNRFLNPGKSISQERAITEIFGPPGKRKNLLVAGCSGIVGFGKTLQFASRLFRHGIKIIAVDLPGTRFNWDEAVRLLSGKFTEEEAGEIARSIIFFPTDKNGRMTGEIQNQDLALIYEAIPEKKELKQIFFQHMRTIWPKAFMLSATSGFQAQVLFEKTENRNLCTIAHPAFPHLTNKWFEIVGPGSGATIDEHAYRKLIDFFLSLGLIPKRVKDVHSFVLDRIFCGLFNFCLLFMEKTCLMPQQVDNMARRLFGPRVNPFFSHDYISGKKFGAANLLTSSCLKDLDEYYGGGLFALHPKLKKALELVRDRHQFVWCQKSPGNITSREEDEEFFKICTLGGLAVVISQILHEKIAGIEAINGITEGCVLFAKGILNMFRALGKKEVCRLAEEFITTNYIDSSLFHPEVFEDMENWRFYVNAEIVGNSNEKFGLVTISRDSYSWGLDKESNLAFDFLLKRNVRRVIIAPDLATSTQFGVGADTTEFASLKDPNDGTQISRCWSLTARRLRNDFDCSVALIKGKAWGGMLELALHCHYVLTEKNASLRFPEVTLKIVPGMGGVHIPFRRVSQEHQKWAFELLMNGEAVSGEEAFKHGLVNFAGSWEEIVNNVFRFMTEGPHQFGNPTPLKDELELTGLALKDLPDCRTHELGFVQPYNNDCREAILTGIKKCCSLPFSIEMIEEQARISGETMFAPWGFLRGRR